MLAYIQNYVYIGIYIYIYVYLYLHFISVGLIWQLLKLPFSQETKAEKEKASSEEQDLQ